MERLTYFKNGHWRMKINGCQYSGEFIDRLAAYENSGLTPEECAVYGKADREGRYIVLRDAEEKGVARLRELALADKDGRLVVLPCEIGTATYYIHYPIAFYPDESEPEIKRGIFTLIVLDTPFF